jgi:hypothetical protein
MSTRPRSQAGPPTTLGNMRANGVRSLDVCCWQCHHRASLSADPWPDHVPVPTFGPRMVCTLREILARTRWRQLAVDLWLEGMPSLAVKNHARVRKERPVLEVGVGTDIIIKFFIAPSLPGVNVVQQIVEINMASCRECNRPIGKYVTFLRSD